MPPPSVLVLDVHRKAGASVIHSLHKGGLRVVAGSSKRINAGFFSRYCYKRVIHPCTETEKEVFQDWLIQFLRSHEIEMVFPISFSVYPTSEIQNEICQYSLYLAPQHNIFMNGYRKISTLKLAREIDIPIPKTWFIEDYAGDLDRLIADISDWPVLIKPSVSIAARGITWCYNAEQLKANYPLLTKTWGDCFVQDFVPPGRYQYKADWLVDYQQNGVAGFVFGKARWYPPAGGSSTLNFSTEKPEILEHALRLLKHMKWVGYCDMDWIDDPRDNIPKLMEINPRYPDTVEMGMNLGLDFPMMMYKLAHGEEFEIPKIANQQMFLRFLPADVMWFLTVDNKARFNTWPNWFNFFDKRTKYQLIYPHDPTVFLGYLLENLLMMGKPAFWNERLRITSRKQKITQGNGNAK